MPVYPKTASHGVKRHRRATVRQAFSISAERMDDHTRVATHDRHNLFHEPKENCWDNAPMESLFASLKGKLVELSDYLTRGAA
jgi:hypothetical protein